MALNVSRVDVWAASIEDKPGGLAGKLSALAKAGAQLEFLVARRAPDKPGTGVVFLTPLKGAALVRAAKKEGFEKTDSLHSIRIEAPDEPGLCARISQAMAEAGINLRGLSAAAVGDRCVAYLAVDAAPDAAKAMKILKKL
ncbi:MAG: ACT domain-containing protein [Pirellulales bacterium]|nr:ACT domain-containing protein [Pirellulales bacterium]